MTRNERIAPFLEALSDDAFEDFLAAASHAASADTIYKTLSSSEKAEIDAAIARLDANEGVPYDEFKARLAVKLKAAGLENPVRPTRSGRTRSADRLFHRA